MEEQFLYNLRGDCSIKPPIVVRDRMGLESGQAVRVTIETLGDE